MRADEAKHAIAVKGLAAALRAAGREIERTTAKIRKLKRKMRRLRRMPPKKPQTIRQYRKRGKGRG